MSVLSTPSFPSVTQMEEAIVIAVVKQLIATGHKLSVDNGGDTYEIKNSTDADAVLKEMRATGEDFLYTKKEGDPKRYVQFVYGNDGYDVICDYTQTLEPYLSDAMALIEQFDPQ